MSYILDALRRADAERERGAVPGLHAQPLPNPASAAEGPRGSPGWLVAGGGALLLVLLGVLAWAALLREPATPVGVVATGAAAPATAAQPEAQAGRDPAAPGGGVAAPALSTQAANPATPLGAATAAVEQAPLSPQDARPMPGSRRPADPLAPRESREARAAREVREARDVREARPAQRREGDVSANGRPPAAAAPATATATASPPERRIYALEELPPEIRRSLPAVTVSGSIYSEDAASRFVMINGEAVREGGRIAPELVLEQIGLKSAVLRFKAYRYRIGL